MKPYIEMTAEELQGELMELKVQYKKVQALGMQLDMSRGKPCQEQLDLSMGAMISFGGVFCAKMMTVYGKLVYTVFDIRDTNYRKLERGFSYRMKTFGARMCSRIIGGLARMYSVEKATHVAVVMGQYKEKEIMTV